MVCFLLSPIYRLQRRVCSAAGSGVGTGLWGSAARLETWRQRSTLLTWSAQILIHIIFDERLQPLPPGRFAARGIGIATSR